MTLEKDLEEVKTAADGIIHEWAIRVSEDAAPFLKEKLDDLGKRREQIQESFASIELTTRTNV